MILLIFYSNIHDTFQFVIQSDITDHFHIIHIDGSLKQFNINTRILARNMSQWNKQDLHCAMSIIDYSEINAQGGI